MTSSLYVPDAAAFITQPWQEAFRTQRDVGLRIPINFLTVPAISLRTACFGHNQYSDWAFQKCFSNLLAAGFRRYVVDVYWDSGRMEWSLCPAQVPPNKPQQESRVPSSVSEASKSLSTANSGRLVKNYVHPTASPAERRAGIRKRQHRSSSALTGTMSVEISTVASRNASAASTNTETTLSPSPTMINTQDVPVLQIGSYNCTQTMTMDLITGIFQDYLDETGTTTDATLIFIILNLHAAASYSSPDAPAEKVTGAQLPLAGQFLSDSLKGNLSEQLYTPNTLQNERSNLNESWYDVQVDTMPAMGYYNTSQDDNHATTQNGWPSEAYTEFKEYFRLVASFGTIDPQMSGYDITPDLGTVFPPQTIRALYNTTINAAGSITSGCLFAPSEIDITSSTNSSWAVSLAPALNLGTDPNITTPIPSITSLTSCGLSPFLNYTLSNVTADQNPVPYLAFTHSTLWSWQPGQPINITEADTDLTRNSCAAIYHTSPYPGRWRTVNCNDRHRFACQNPNNPYHWELSTVSADYMSGGSACPPPLTFSVPHTALENAHLLAALTSPSTRNPPTSPSPVFVNLNSLDIPNCWVPQINGTCPYQARKDTDTIRVVVVPTVASVIIFVLAALTFFVKCAANRREDKRGRRRRMVGGWEYEGVPS
ncbi:hypothetical protein P154DRAFT_551902 [Amniculicola lignicola CBS 123094]|uniref:Maintenance of telomere capping protein 6 n=1 Tax=Amniculicola lignicola CBS 123094 TaxID=1392246 RepID=A0A6A5X201_9PLEO|nr:hypothetical protein P154DRAFT_551902 [Amniculicola lignicola CBS 123094]